VEKAKWYNHQYILEMSDTDLAKQFMPVLQEKGISASTAKVEKAVGLVKERVHFISELWDQSYFFFIAPTTYDEKTVNKRWKEETPGQMQQLTGLLEGMDDFSAANQEKTVMDWIQQNQYHTGNVMNAFRLAIVGAGKGPHMFDITEVIGKEETLRRIQQAISTLP
jgi:glutamyl-tRNA synthetase